VNAPGSLGGACGVAGEVGAVAGAPAEADRKSFVNSPGWFEDGGAGAGGLACASGSGADPAPEEDWNVRVNSPGSLAPGALEAGFCCAEPGAGAEIGEADAGDASASALNICVKLLGGSDGRAGRIAS
jgi:hypothetical protein